MISRLVLTVSQWQEIENHAQSQIPLEACGLLAGRNDRVEKVITVANQAKSPARFVMDPYEQLDAFQWIESHGLELVGIFHSHPSGPEIASPTDIGEAAYQVVHLIVSPHDDQWKAHGFWIEQGRATEVPIEILK